jgi:hypothetical protein
MTIHKNVQFLNSSVLPKAKVLKEEKERLQKLRDYLEKRLAQQELYLKALAEVSNSKPKYVEIREVEVKANEAKLSVNLSGNAPAYEDVNVFLVNLKKERRYKRCKDILFYFSFGRDKGDYF